LGGGGGQKGNKGRGREGSGGWGGGGGAGRGRRLGGVWEALTVAGLVAAFVAVAGLAALTVYRLWAGSAEPSTGTDGLDG